jgi:hypothetical protein
MRHGPRMCGFNLAAAEWSSNPALIENGLNPILTCHS